MKREKIINEMGLSIFKNPSPLFSCPDPLTLIRKPEDMSKIEFDFIMEALTPLEKTHFKYFFLLTTSFEIIISEALRSLPDEYKYYWDWEAFEENISRLGLSRDTEKALIQVFKDQTVKEEKKKRCYLYVPKIGPEKNEPFSKDGEYYESGKFFLSVDRKWIVSKEGVFKVPDGAELSEDAEGNKFLSLRRVKGPFSENKEIILYSDRRHKVDRIRYDSKDLKLPIKTQKKDIVEIELKSARQMIAYQSFILNKAFRDYIKKRYRDIADSGLQMTIKDLSLHKIITSILKAIYGPISNKMKNLTYADVRSYADQVKTKDKQHDKLISLYKYLIEPLP